MKVSIHLVLLGLVLSAAVFVGARRVGAVLGESADSIEADRAALSAVRHTTAGADSYSVHEIGSEAITVREYVSTSGVVFAIVWKGMVHADLSRLLGSYAGEYHEALQQISRERGSRHLRVKTPHIVVEKWGHMRSLQGRAYVPALIPAGVSVNEIR